MKRSESRGKTRWARFAGIFGLALAGAALLLTGLSQGALAASFAVSGSAFKISADKLVGEGFVQYGDVDQGSGEAHVVAVGAFRKATLDNFCQSVFLPKVPMVGDVTLVLVSGGPGGMESTDIIIGIASLTGDLLLTDTQIGIDAAQLSKGPEAAKGRAGAFGLQASGATIGQLRQIAWSTNAQTLRLKNLALSLRSGKNECF
ncbi:cholesterol esterase [Amycolatopsis coloradensis]|uniref:Cholesterol esterase n=1 Tax=Amycolatopsis coloradensis TaxID=76021 RepID=A0A1R0KFJ9_9PSEU|nr:DUF6230 family protein [Amycolatopsis coloradensis]OLZ44154.1 cholesterol esterase [Amycolatopsis coloradensis]